MNTLKTFNELEYVRPDFEAFKEFYIRINERAKSAKTYEELKECIKEEEEYSSHVNTMATIAEIRHTVDTDRKSVV